MKMKMKKQAFFGQSSINTKQIVLHRKSFANSYSNLPSPNQSVNKSAINEYPHLADLDGKDHQQPRQTLANFMQPQLHGGSRIFTQHRENREITKLPFKQKKMGDTPLRHSAAILKSIIAPLNLRPKTQQITISNESMQIKENRKQKLQQKRQQLYKLQQNVEGRYLLFNKFAFKKQDLVENQSIVPLIEKLTNSKVQGSMHIIDLWNKSQQNNYLGIVQFNNSSYILRDLARLQQNFKSAMLKRTLDTEKAKHNTFTKLDEQQLKLKIETQQLGIAANQRQAGSEIVPDYSYQLRVISKDLKHIFNNFDENLELAERDQLIAFLQQHNINFNKEIYNELMKNSDSRKRLGYYFIREHDNMRSQCYSYHQYYVQQELKQQKLSLSGGLLRLFQVKQFQRKSLKNFENLVQRILKCEEQNYMSQPQTQLIVAPGTEVSKSVSKIIQKIDKFRKDNLDIKEDLNEQIEKIQKTMIIKNQALWKKKNYNKFLSQLSA